MRFLLGQNLLADPTEACVPQLWTFYASEREGSRVSLGGDIPLGVNAPAWGSMWGGAECLGMAPGVLCSPVQTHT